METEFKTLSEEIKNLFEIEYLDTMADVQGDVTKIIKEFIKLLQKNKVVRFNSDGSPERVILIIDLNAFAGEKLVKEVKE